MLAAKNTVVMLAENLSPALPPCTFICLSIRFNYFHQYPELSLSANAKCEVPAAATPGPRQFKRSPMYFVDGVDVNRIS
jgi:hypothetical protein